MILYGFLLRNLIFINNITRGMNVTASTRVVVGAIAAIAIMLIAAFAAYALMQDKNNQEIMSADDIQEDESKMVVYATFFAIHKFAKNVAGDHATVENLIPFNVEPHNYEITPKRLVSLSEGDMMVYNGADFEPFVADIIDSGSFEHLVFVDTTKGIDLLDADHGDDDEHQGESGHGDDEHGDDEHSFAYDPHVWLDPILARQQVQTIADAMAQNDPDNAEHYQQNAQDYSEKLDALDNKIRQELSSCKKDTFVPFHNAFTYFAERYGLHIQPLTGLSPEQDATARDIVEFIKFAQENDIKYFFTEEMSDTRLSEQLAQEVGGAVLVFSPIEGLSTEDQKLNATYIDKMEDNLENLKIALECS